MCSRLLLIGLSLGIVSFAENVDPTKADGTDSKDDIGGGVCVKDSCSDTAPIDWESENVGKQLISWLAQQRSTQGSTSQV